MDNPDEIRDDPSVVFEKARQLDGAERQAYLYQACRGNPTLRVNIESMLVAHAAQGEFLAEPTVSVEQGEVAAPGSMIGPYKLREQIGEGGMGVVFVAEQLAPLQRKVALKIIKPGMDSKSVIARFEAERQALAMMDHPNIAKVLDAGTTELGRPYFAMELVRGIPITEYCDRNKLTIKERLELFVQVCQAIQHAHQKGIIHRDIKPSNVLVTLHDGRPVPRVIDFGVAKAINARLTDKTVYTAHLQIVGTLLYMSPEQAEMSGLDVDTRSDIYALGVLLYELLTGTTPFQESDLRDAGFDEQRRIIREEDPPRASARISSLGETATGVAQHRKTDKGRLHQLVHGDLDWIVFKTLEKDRTRRYKTAAGLAEDVERHLANEPVVACPPSITYRFRKFRRRNRVALAATLLVTCSLAIGLSIAGWTTYESYRRQQAHRELIFDQTMRAAVHGDIRLLNRLVEDENAGIPEHWHRFLQGMVHFYDGDMSAAIGDFELSFELDESNMAACALLAICLSWQGEWDQAFAHADCLKTMKPRDDYEDYDLLFYSLLNIYRLGEEEADPWFEDQLREYPNSALIWLFRTVACTQTALWEGDLELARLNANRNAVVIEELLPENALSQAMSLFSIANYIQLANLAGESTDAARVRGDKMVAAMHGELFYLDPYCRAMYFEAIGEHKAALANWKKMGRLGLNPYYVPEALRQGKHEAAVEYLLMDGAPRKMVSLPMEGEVRIERGVATDYVEEMPDSSGLAVVLYLGNQETISEEVVELEQDQGVYYWFNCTFAQPPRAKQFLLQEEGVDADALVADVRADRGKANAYYFIGLDHMAHGRYLAAKETFRKVVAFGQISDPTYYIARLLCERLENKGK